MTDLTGLELEEAESILKEKDCEYFTVQYSAPKPLTDTDCAVVIRQREVDGKFELTVSRFKKRL